MVICGITLIPLVVGLWVADPGILTSFYSDDMAFYGLERWRYQILKLLLDTGPDRGYFPDPSKLLFISYSLDQEEVVNQEFEAEGGGATPDLCRG